nr:uncharacterized protein LOC124816205 [Hydra vulgaris]
MVMPYTDITYETENCNETDTAYQNEFSYTPKDQAEAITAHYEPSPINESQDKITEKSKLKGKTLIQKFTAWTSSVYKMGCSDSEFKNSEETFLDVTYDDIVNYFAFSLSIYAAEDMKILFHCKGKDKRDFEESFVKKLVDYETTDSDSEVSVAQNSSTDNTDYTDSEVSVCSNSIITDYIDSEVKEKNKHLRPKRFCIFCKKSYFKLSRHQQNKHKNQIDVKETLLLPKKQRDRVFALLRRKEIVNYNRLEALKENPNYLSERKTKHTINLTKCNNCKIVVARRTFYRHKKQCQLSSYEDIQHEPLAHLETLENFQIAQTSIELLFKTKILNSFRNDKIGKLCRTDATIIEIGMQLLLKVKSKQEKEIEVYRSVRNEMRRLSHLYTLFLKENDIECKYNNSMDMFARKNFNILVRVIEIFTKKDCNDIKAGLKINLYYLIKKCTKMLENLYYRKMMDNDAKEMAKFGKTLKSWQNEIFSDAINKINMSCETKLRKSVKFPEENDLK